MDRAAPEIRPAKVARTHTGCPVVSEQIQQLQRMVNSKDEKVVRGVQQLREFAVAPAEAREARKPSKEASTTAFAILGVNENSPRSDVKSSLRQLQRALHPDKQHAHAQKNVPLLLLLLVNAAGQVLESLQPRQENYKCFSRSERYRGERRKVQDDLEEQLQLARLAPINVNLGALEKAVEDAQALGFANLELHKPWLNDAIRALKRARVDQQQASCEAAGGVDLTQGAPCGHAARYNPENQTEDTFTIGTFGCRCGADHFYVVESTGYTGIEPFGPGSQIQLIACADGQHVFPHQDAVDVAEHRYKEVTCLSLTESTSAPASRPRQWSSTGKLCLEDPNYVLPMWQFERTDSADGYQPGWHNYRPDPETGADSIKIVEALYRENQEYQRNSAGKSMASERHVRSAQFYYTLQFNATALDSSTIHGTQTNTQTKVKRQVRRVSLSDACICVKCAEPPLSQKASARQAAPGAFRIHPMGAPQPEVGLAAPLLTHRELSAPPSNSREAWGDLPGDATYQDRLLAKVTCVGGLPRCWRNKAASSEPELVDVFGEEREEVEGHFRQTLGRAGATVGEVKRVENHAVFASCNLVGDMAIMFHGCKSLSNEKSIIENGFQIDKCRSGGNNYGTWFAYISSYSDGSFALTDSKGWKHIFVCVVSRNGQRLDNATMRVVGQGAAYPQWLVVYRH